MPGSCRMTDRILIVMIMIVVAVSAHAQRRDTVNLPGVDVNSDRSKGATISHAPDVEAGAIYAGKKTEVIRLDRITANTATNNPRQVFAGVAGLNIWESDGSGLQLGIGGRGLSPNRTSNFTTRQNGYEISADPLGYPESYYTPPMEALQRIELVRGAASLRYGTQFGGMVNFIMRDGALDRPVESRIRLTGGSYGFANLFGQVGGTIDGTRYIGMYQYRRADGWRQNSEYDVHTAYAAVGHAFGDRLRIKADYTFMTYTAHQPGGLTDRQFLLDPQESLRERNWFRVDWKLASITLDYIIADDLALRSQFFGNASGRTALGNLERINVVDLGGERTMIDGTFRNIGNETSLTCDVDMLGEQSTVVVGWRLFHGTTRQRQGNGSAGSDPDFRFLRPDDLEGSDYRFPNDNAALFAESVIRLGGGFAIVPGVRFEHITTRAEGYYKQRVTDFAGNVIVDTNIDESRTRSRSFVLFGLGATYQLPGGLELYGNLAQNYRSITFSDLRINNPNLRVDSNITDERGYTADIGVRGQIADVVTLDASLFYLRYDRRIGQILKADEPPLYLPYRFRTNIADAYTAGLETVLEWDVTSTFTHDEAVPHVRLMVNASLLDGRYINTQDASIRDKQVELVPPYTVRGGISASWKGVRASFLYSAVGKHYTDATNAEYSATAVNGAIPAYRVADLSVQYAFDRFTIEGSCNNLFDERYFTRRADSYPGPGIIPAEARSLFLTLQVVI